MRALHDIYAVMHKSLSWDDARILLAVVRHGTQDAASKMLGIDQATVSRRLLRLEDAIGTPLFLRDGTRLTPTDVGRRMAERAEEAEASLAAAFAVDQHGESEGVVRITAVPMITAHVLAPALRLLRELAPGVVVELVGTQENLSLTRREADIALRLARPASGSFLARRVGMVGYGVFARRGIDPNTLPWIGFDETLADLPEAQWLAKQEDDQSVIARAADTETIYQAVRSGFCRGVLPRAIGRRDSALVMLPTSNPLPSRELWLMVERQVRQIRRVSLGLGWVEAVVRDAFSQSAVPAT
ncbi:MAG TPA: LysR family transcriptional regulator [Xanthobacteraceae bacterium]|nr:LysR family transcriptional regulator [Xanthobacteraceae bacterium]